MLTLSVITITLALVFYSIGVWGEKLGGRLTGWNLAMFWAGFVFDTTGTTLMTRMQTAPGPNIHGVTGLAAIILMAAHALWASIVLGKKNEKWIRSFHRFSVPVWFIWLIPYGTGMILNIAK